ncbi:MAG: yejB [Candidatus Midichloriaceae bacterium]|jgi:microcin C transport system permease protein|nr:yejB [Candidatus Midichloriaceae bacterium]
MLNYILKRIFLIFPTLLFIIIINFAIVQLAPGGPVEMTLASIRDLQQSESATGRVSAVKQFKASKGLDDELVTYIKKLYGFDKPPLERLWIMIKNYVSFDLGYSYFRNKQVGELILEKIPVSLSLGLWSTLIIYLVSIPLGIKKAIKNSEGFDGWTSFIIAFAYALPSFLVAIILLLLFAGDGPFSYFPIRGIVSHNWDSLTAVDKVKDYAWHMVLPTLTLAISGFATITMLTKNSFLEEIHKQYVITARAKGLSENQILYGHVFRNAMLIVITSIPDALIKVFITGSLLIEIIFSLDGIGLLSYESAVGRDYPVVFGTLYIFILIGLIANLATDIIYMIVDPRIDFERRD